MYVDFKAADARRHEFYTGVSNERIKENLMKTDREFAGDIHISIPEIRHSQKRTACVMICSDDNKEELI